MLLIRSLKMEYWMKIGENTSKSVLLSKSVFHSLRYISEVRKEWYLLHILAYILSLVLG